MVRPENEAAPFVVATCVVPLNAPPAPFSVAVTCVPLVVTSLPLTSTSFIDPLAASAVAFVAFDDGCAVITTCVGAPGPSAMVPDEILPSPVELNASV